MTCLDRHTTKACSTGTASPDILTYRYEGELVYVPVAPDYIVSPVLYNILSSEVDAGDWMQQALSHARDAFPQLKGLGDASLSLSMTLTSPGITQQFARISALAWPKLIVHMSRYQIIDVQVTQAHERDVAVPIPDITTTHADANDVKEAGPALPYRRSDDVDDDKASHPCPQ